VIRFFPTFSHDAADTPYGEGLRRLGRAALEHDETDLDTLGHLMRLVEAIGAEGGGKVA